MRLLPQISVSTRVSQGDESQCRIKHTMRMPSARSAEHPEADEGEAGDVGSDAITS